MAEDKFTAVWVSHTSISDFLRCPRAYYLKNMYRDPKTGHKIKLISPPLALGQIVHEVLESLSTLPVEERFTKSPVETYHLLWKKIKGKKGGFTDESVEEQYKKRGEEMLNRVMKNPGPLMNLAVKIKMDLPYYWLSTKDNIILCGKIDWLEYIPDTDSVHIIDFKTSKKDEEDGSLQLSIYSLLTANCQSKPVSKISYWYIGRSDEPTKQIMPDMKQQEEKILEIAKKMKLARQLSVFKCPETSGCRDCRPYEAILRGEAELVGLGSYREDMYILDVSGSSAKEKSVIL
ncbi:MAG: PD-(D/E)XK nuclease family protein [Patescibacteria group bacterium]